MNANTVTCNIFHAVEPSNIPLDIDFGNTESYNEEHSLSILADLYYKHEDEPDFDCEFLTDSEDFAY